MKRVLLLALALLPIAALADDHGVALDTRGIVSAYGSSSDPNSDVTSTASALTGPISASEYAFRTDSGAGGVASSSVTGDLGSFSYSAMAYANQTPTAPGSAYVGGEGHPSYESWDRFTVTGAPGTFGTFKLHLALRDLSVYSSNGKGEGLERTGLQSSVHFVTASGALNSMGYAYDFIDSGVELTSLDFYTTFTVQTGDLLTIDYQMRGAAVAQIDYDGLNESANASASGRGFLTLDSETPGITITSSSGHIYATPEPTGFLALAAGLLPIVIRRRRKASQP